MGAGRQAAPKALSTSLLLLCAFRSLASSGFLPSWTVIVRPCAHRCISHLLQVYGVHDDGPRGSGISTDLVADGLYKATHCFSVWENRRLRVHLVPPHPRCGDSDCVSGA